MLSKLAFRNAKRSIKDYMIYLITVILAFSLIFSFNLIIFSKDILELSSFMKNLQMSVFFVSGIILFVIGWLIHYTMKFMLSKRSKEFGTYMILGIEKKSITKLFLLENIFLGFIALLISFVIGYGISQVMTMIIMNIFELPYKVTFSLKMIPILLTFLYFGIIYFFVLFKAYWKIKKMKLYDLLYLEKQNEDKIYKSKKRRTIYFIISILLGGGALSLFNFVFESMKSSTNDGMAFPFIVIALFLLIFSIYGVTLTFADFITSLVVKNKKLKYRKDHLFVVRQFSSKVKTMGITMGTLSLLITFTLISLNVSNVFNGMFQTQSKSVAPYDVQIYDFYREPAELNQRISNDQIEAYISYIEKSYTIEDFIAYDIYTNLTDRIKKQITDGVVGYQPYDAYLKLSDYNHLLRMRGMEEISLKEDEFYIHSFRDVSKELQKYLKKYPTLPIGEKQLQSGGFSDYKFATAWSMGSSYLVIVPDEMITEEFKIFHTVTSVKTKEETKEEFLNQLEKQFPRVSELLETEGGYTMEYILRNIEVKGAIDAQNKSFITIISFCLMYLAFIFIAVVGTILAIQSLSDSTKYKYRYTILKKMGMEDHQIYKTIRKQLFLNFSLPMFYPILISMITSSSLKLIFDSFMESDHSIFLYVLSNIVLFLAIYLLYFLATYYGFKNNIKEGN